MTVVLWKVLLGALALTLAAVVPGLRSPEDISTLSVTSQPWREAPSSPIPGKEITTILLGGTGSEIARAVAVDEAGRVYVTGSTLSADFPATVAYGPRGDGDIFVVRLSSNGTVPDYAAVVGGSSWEGSYAIAVDQGENVYVTGYTYSVDFPTTPGAYQPSGVGSTEAFVLKLDQNGLLAYATYLGGEFEDYGGGIAIDQTGAATVAGITTSLGFPTTAGAYDETCGSDGLCDFDGVARRPDAFVARLNGTGSGLDYATFLGGSGSDYGYSIALVEPYGLYVVGTSSSVDFPVLPASVGGLGGGSEAFLATLSRDGSTLLLSVPFGGAGPEAATSVATDPTGNPILCGATASVDFPITADAFDFTPGGPAGDAYVARFDSAGAMTYGSYLGGSGVDPCFSLALDAVGNPVVAGWANSTDFPGAVPLGNASAGTDYNAFVSVMGADGAFKTLIAGGTNTDFGWGVAVSPREGTIYAVGETWSKDFPAVVAQFGPLSPAGGTDAFVLVLRSVSPKNGVPTASLTAVAGVEGGSSLLDASASSDPDGDALQYRWDLDGDGTWDTPYSADPTVTATWGDDYSGTAVVEVFDGTDTATAAVAVSVTNADPALGSVDVQAGGGEATLTLRVAGEKYHDIAATLTRNGGAVATATILRVPGSPDAQSMTLGTVTRSADAYAVEVVYTPLDDAINGQVNGADPAWLVLTQGGTEVRLHHTFNVRHPEGWTWTVDDLGQYVQPAGVQLAFDVADPGSDDLSVTVDWGDSATDTFFFPNNASLGADPDPSPDLNPRLVAVTATHAYAAPGTYTVTITVEDDDGGSATLVLTVTT